MTRARLVIALGAAALLASTGCAKVKRWVKRDPTPSSGDPTPTDTDSRSRRPPVRMPDGDDAAPAKPLEPAESAKAAPAGVRGAGYAPVLYQTEAAQVFAATPPGPVTDAPGLLVCKLETSRRPDGGFKALFGTSLPDLDLEAVIAGYRVDAHGPEDRTVAYLTAPLVKLDRKAPITIHVFDRDELGRDDLDSVPATPRDTVPFEGVAEGHTLTCTHLSGAAFASRVTARIAKTDRELGGVAANISASISEPRLGRQMVESACEEGERSLAAWMGWADARVARRRAWCDAMRARHREVAREVVDRERARASAAATVATSHDRYEARAEKISCDPAKVARELGGIHPAHRRPLHHRDEPRCLLTMRFTLADADDAASPLSEMLLGKLAVTFARADGETSEGEVYATERDPGGRATTVWVGTTDDVTPSPAGASILVVRPMAPATSAVLAWPPG